MSEMRGNNIECSRCGGHGFVTIWSFGVKEPDECEDCGGSGVNWLYPNGAIAKYFSGPFVGFRPFPKPIQKKGNENERV